MTESQIKRLEEKGKVTLLFISEYCKFHIEPLCSALHVALGENFLLVETGTYNEDLMTTGNLSGPKKDAYSISLVQHPEYSELVDRLCVSSDLLILGFGQPCYRYNQLRLRHDPSALTMKYKERIFRWGIDKRSDKRYHDNLDYKYTNWFGCAYYVLCASAYTAYDMTLLGARREQLLQFGYWPEKCRLSWEALKQKKSRGEATILWVGRFVHLKHPQTAIAVMDALADRDIRLLMVGYGELEEPLKNMVREVGLGDKVRFTGALNNAGVRDLMEQADVLLFTSDYREGWGMVLSEAMASGCCVISSAAAGASPVLIENRKNGFLFDHNDPAAAAVILAELLDKGREAIWEIGRTAYQFTQQAWNAETAAERLITLCREYAAAGTIQPFPDGICSVSQILPGYENLPEPDRSGRKEEIGFESFHRDSGT